MKNFVQPGDVVTIPAPANVVSGAGVLAGTLFGVASTDAVSGAPVAVAVTGVFELPKVSAQAWTVGAAIYWIAADGVCTTAASGNTLIGNAVAAAANPSATGVVRLNG
jgi:predicted RecA/RadA family phage recombinase